MSGLLENKCAIITGASLGLGFEIAKRYLESGASLMICARNEELLDKAAAELRRLTPPGQSLLALPADISKPLDVKLLIDRTLVQFGQLDILVNNAAIAGPSGPIETIDWHEWMRTVEINLLGAVLLSRAVLPHFKQVKRGKIIQLSGGGATSPLPHLSAYAVSKAAVVRFVETLAEENREHHIDVNAIAPGALNTRMLDDILAGGPECIGAELHERLLREKQSGGTPLGRGAELAVFLGSSLSDGITGKLISAVWDPWAAFPDRLDELNGTDIYTLRRISPKDRGMSWGDVD
jgi:NAD(P)-dependent dehydrogenase (short-subunit alcohol dehydrogenase family)